MPEKDLTKQACKLNGRANSNAAFYGVEDTIYIPLASRIRISKKFPQYFLDTKALELEKKIPQAATNTELYSHITFFRETRRILRKELSFSSKVLMWLGDILKKSNILHLKLNPAND